MQALIFIIWMNLTTWTYMGILFGIDVLFVIMLSVDRLQYKYEMVPADSVKLLED
jgi:hypothetical protein